MNWQADQAFGEARKGGRLTLAWDAFGARLDLPQNRHAACLARETQNREIETILSEHLDEGGLEPSCPDRQADAPTPLVAWTQSADDVHASDPR